MLVEVQLLVLVQLLSCCSSPPDQQTKGDGMWSVQISPADTAMLPPPPTVRVTSFCPGL